MNLLQVALIFSQVVCFCSSKSDFVSIAISKIIKKHFVKNSIHFDFVLNTTLHETLRKAVQIVGVDFSYQVIDYAKSVDCSDEKNNVEDDINLERFRQNQSAIIMFDNFTEYWKFDTEDRKRVG